jgi:inhibitor of cysteine peptidase
MIHRGPGWLVLSAAGAVTLILASLAVVPPGRVLAQVSEPTCPAQSDQTQPIMAKTGNMFAIGLPSNPTTGFLWRMDSPPDATVAQLQAAVYVAAATPATGSPPIAGAGGRECWIFSAVAAGQTTITLDYLRPFDPPATPPGQSDTFTVVVAGS